jgi:hypothetical protein
MKTEVQECLEDLKEGLSKDGAYSELVKFRMPFLSSVATYPEVINSDFLIFSLILTINLAGKTFTSTIGILARILGISVSTSPKIRPIKSLVY